MGKRELVEDLVYGIRSNYSASLSDTCSTCNEHEKAVELDKCSFCMQSDLADIVGDELADNIHGSISDFVESYTAALKLVEA